MRFSPLTQLTPANVEQLKVAWVYHMRPAAAARDAASTGTPPSRRGRGRGGTGFSSSEITPLVINGTMYIADAVLPRRRARRDDGQGTMGLPAAVRQSVDARRRVLAGRRADAAADRVRHERRQALLARRQDRRAQRGVRRQRAWSRSTRRRSCRGCPDSNGLSSPPIVYKNLVITGGTTQENPPRGPAGDVRAWDMHTGKLVWTFRSIPRAGEKYNDTWAGDSWKNRSGVNVWGFITVDAAARHRLHAVWRAIGRSVRRRPRRRQPVRHEPRRRRRQHRQVSLALSGRAPRHLGRRPRRRAGADRRASRAAQRFPPSR